MHSAFFVCIEGAHKRSIFWSFNWNMGRSACFEQPETDSKRRFGCTKYDYTPAALPPTPPPLGHFFPLALLLLLAARGALPISVAGPLTNGSAESLPAMLMGTTLADLVGRSPFRSPPPSPPFAFGQEEQNLVA